MNVFEAVKQSVSTRQAAEMYGLKVKRNGMVLCPFHNDKNPSMKVDKRFHCFACQADGDVIDFVSKLFGIGLKEAANKLACDFGIETGKQVQTECYVKIKVKLIEEHRIQAAEKRCYRVLSDYYHLLQRWKKIYAPESENTVWNPLFTEALQKENHIRYLMDILLLETAEEKAEVIAEHGKEVTELEQRMSEFAHSNKKSIDRGGR